MRRTNMGAQINDHCLGWFEEASAVALSGISVKCLLLSQLTAGRPIAAICAWTANGMTGRT